MDDRQHITFLVSAGLELVTHLFATCKTVLLYEMNNRAVQRSLDDLHGALGTILDHEAPAVIRVGGEFLHINDVRLPMDAAHYAPIQFVIDEMRKRDVQSISFDAGTTRIDAGRFLKTLLSIDPGEDAFTSLTTALDAAGVSAVSLVYQAERESELVDETRDYKLREDSNRVYFRTVTLVGEIMQTIEDKHIIQVRKAKRLTQQMVDIIQTDESMLMGLASIKSFDAYTFVHSVNVCLLSMLMADRMGMSRSDVARMGVAALFHDIGKTYVPTSILNSTGKLSDQEWELMKYHTLFGVKELSRMRSLRDAVDPMFVALQHHVHLNNNGYPQRPGGWKHRLFSRICTVADYYDAMTSHRTYQPNPLTPDIALRFILENSGEIFDPVIVKTFIRAMGLYPVGSVVELDTGEKAVVTKQNPDSKYIHRPAVEIVTDDEKDESKWIPADLTEKSTNARSYKRSVVRTIHDSNTGINKAVRFLLK